MFGKRTKDGTTRRPPHELAGTVIDDALSDNL